MRRKSWRGVALAAVVGGLGGGLLFLGADPLDRPFSAASRFESEREAASDAEHGEGSTAPPPLPPSPRPAPPPTPFSPAATLLGRPRGALAPAPRSVLTHDGVRVLPLKDTRTWMESLDAHWRATRRDVSPETTLALLEAGLEEATSDLTRQNVIFLAALLLPPETAYSFLRRVEATGDDGDQEDALVALAFDGDEDAMRRFEALARVPSEAEMPDVVWHLGQAEERALANPPGTRALMRSYRAIEVLDRVPYFKEVLVKARKRAWLPHPRPDVEHSRRARRAWLDRYPRHPGADDEAFRIALTYGWDEAPLERARWLLRASVLPDQDIAHGALDRLIAASEGQLSRADLARLIDDGEVGRFNRTLLVYMLLRRTAAEVGFDAAIAETARIAALEAHGPLAEAWRRRGWEPPPEGLRSGLTPLPEEDPLLAQTAPAPPAEPSADGAMRPPDRFGGAFSGYTFRGQPDAWRVDPPEEVLVPHTRAIARQFRLWETLAELERRAQRLRGDARADLLYKQAAVFYHEPHVLFPAYAEVSSYHRWLVGLSDAEVDDQGLFEGLHPYESRNYSLLRALALFHRIEREHPDYEGLDRVVFSEAMAWKKLIAYWPFDARASYSDRQPQLIRRLVETFERVGREFPDSPLADDAARAAAWWRRARPAAWTGER